jgi:hypothetical protein
LRSSRSGPPQTPRYWASKNRDAPRAQLGGGCLLWAFFQRSGDVPQIVTQKPQCESIAPQASPVQCNWAMLSIPPRTIRVVAPPRPRPSPMGGVIHLGGPSLGQPVLIFGRSVTVMMRPSPASPGPSSHGGSGHSRCAKCFVPTKLRHHQFLPRDGVDALPKSLHCVGQCECRWVPWTLSSCVLWQWGHFTSTLAFHENDSESLQQRRLKISGPRGEEALQAPPFQAEARRSLSHPISKTPLEGRGLLSLALAFV